MIDPFPKPNKKLNTQKPYLVEATNCDIDFITKTNPTNYMKAATTVAAATTTINSDSDTTPSATSPQYNEAMRDNVMRELLETEENYVKLLSSICLG